PIHGITHESIVREIEKSKTPIQYIERVKLASALAEFLRPHDVCITLGAGDIAKVSAEVLAQFQVKPPKRLKVGVVMGGRSVEHEVSLMSSEHVLNSLHPHLYDVEQFGITRQGTWITGPDTRSQLLNGTVSVASTISPEV